MRKYPKYELSKAQIEKIDLQRFRDSFASFIHSHEVGREYTKKDFSEHLLSDGFKQEELTIKINIVNQAFSSLFHPCYLEGGALLLFLKDGSIIRTRYTPEYSD